MKKKASAPPPAPNTKHQTNLMPKNCNNDAGTIRLPQFTSEQRAQIPTLAFIELSRRFTDAGWPHSAYEEMAALCSKHHLATAHLWRRFAYWRGMK